MAKKTVTPSAAPEGKPSTKPGVKPKADAAPNVQLVEIIESFDQQVEKAESFFVDMVEFIQKNQIDRDTVVVSMMKARGITFESAQTQYSRMKGLLNDEATLQELKEGKITLKVARQRTVKPQVNPKGSKPEAKEQKFSSTLKSFVSAAKESGFTLSEILTSVTAELKAAGIK